MASASEERAGVAARHQLVGSLEQRGGIARSVRGALRIKHSAQAVQRDRLAAARDDNCFADPGYSGRARGAGCPGIVEAAQNALREVVKRSRIRRRQSSARHASAAAWSRRESAIRQNSKSVGAQAIVWRHGFAGSMRFHGERRLGGARRWGAKRRRREEKAMAIGADLDLPRLRQAN